MNNLAPSGPRIEELMQQVSQLSDAIRERDEIARIAAIEVSQLSDAIRARDEFARIAAIVAAQARDHTPTILTEPRVPLPEKSDGSRQKFRGFLNQLTLLFTLNPTRYANDKIRKLRQNLTSTSQYATTFQHLAADLQWNESALMAQFREGLSEDVKDMLLHHDQPISLASMISLSIRCEGWNYI